MYLLQAKDSGTGGMHYWTSATADASDYPGPNTATELCVVAENQSAAGGSLPSAHGFMLAAGIGNNVQVPAISIIDEVGGVTLSSGAIVVPSSGVYRYSWRMRVQSYGGSVGSIVGTFCQWNTVGPDPAPHVQEGYESDYKTIVSGETHRRVTAGAELSFRSILAGTGTITGQWQLAKISD